MNDPVEAQVAAFNARDLEGFVACYAPDVLIEDGDGNVMAEGHEGMRALWGPLFAQSPKLHAEIVQRMRVGEYVIDEEHGSGIQLEGFPNELHSAAIYRLKDGLIVHARLLF